LLAVEVVGEPTGEGEEVEREATALQLETRVQTLPLNQLLVFLLTQLTRSLWEVAVQLHLVATLLVVSEIVQFFTLLQLLGVDLEDVLPLGDNLLGEARGVVRDINPLSQGLELLVRALMGVQDKTTEVQPLTGEVEEVPQLTDKLAALVPLAVMD
jgi:hypothetical protein